MQVHPSIPRRRMWRVCSRRSTSLRSSTSSTAPGPSSRPAPAPSSTAASSPIRRSRRARWWRRRAAARRRRPRAAPAPSRRDGVRDGGHVHRRRQPVLAGDGMVDPRRTRPVVPVGRRVVRDPDRRHRLRCPRRRRASGTVTAPLAGGTADTFAKWLAAVLAGASIVYVATRAMVGHALAVAGHVLRGRRADRHRRRPAHHARHPERRGLSGTLAGLNVVVSAGFGARPRSSVTRRRSLSRRTPGAPVQLRAVEPAIGGLEVGIIGAFKAIAFDDDRFCQPHVETAWLTLEQPTWRVSCVSKG